MHRVVILNHRASPKEGKSLYLYMDKSYQIVKPDMNKFNGDWRGLALAVCPNHTKFVVK